MKYTLLVNNQTKQVKTGLLFYPENSNYSQDLEVVFSSLDYDEDRARLGHNTFELNIYKSIDSDRRFPLVNLHRKYAISISRCMKQIFITYTVVDFTDLRTNIGSYIYFYGRTFVRLPLNETKKLMDKLVEEEREINEFKRIETLGQCLYQITKPEEDLKVHSLI